MDAMNIPVLIVGIVLLLAALVGLIVLIRKSIRNSKKKEEKETIPEVDKSISNLLPIRYDVEHNFYRFDGMIFDIFKIVTKDQNSASSSEKNWDNMKFAKFYKMYADDIKIYALNFPCNTQEQQSYWQHKIDSTSNKVLQNLQKQRLYQLEWLEKNNTSREFYLWISAKNEDDFYKNKSTMMTILGTGKDGLIEVMEPEKKHQILFKLNNKSSYIF